MDFKNRGGGSNQFRRTTDQHSGSNDFWDDEPAKKPTFNQPSHHQKTPSKPKKPTNKLAKLNLISKFSTLSLFVFSAILLILVIFSITLIKENSSEKKLINVNGYQAVFLNSSDNQVYFGKLAIYNKDLYSLTDAYYIRVSKEGQQQDVKSSISLAKLGDALHCPADQMFIARDKVLYWENILDKGQVVQAIKDYKKSGKKIDCTQNTSNNLDQAQTPTPDANKEQKKDTPKPPQSQPEQNSDN